MPSSISHPLSSRAAIRDKFYSLVFGPREDPCRQNSALGNHIIEIKQHLEEFEQRKLSNKHLGAEKKTTNLYESALENTINTLQRATYFSWGVTIISGLYTTYLCYNHENCQRILGSAVAGGFALIAQVASSFFSDKQARAKEKLEKTKQENRRLKAAEKKFLQHYSLLHNAKHGTEKEMQRKVQECVKKLGLCYFLRNNCKQPKKKLTSTIVEALPTNHPLRKTKDCYLIGSDCIPLEYQSKLPHSILHLSNRPIKRI